MIKTATISANAYIENLKAQLDQVGSRKLDYLVIAHPDQRMLSQLQLAFEKSSVAVISVPQNCWVMDDDNMFELVNFALNETSAKRVLLVGSSQGGTPDEAVQVCPSGKVAAESQGSRLSLIERLNLAQACTRKNEAHFIEELQCLRNNVSLHNDRVASPDLVQGIFYRVESGVFCAYDCDNNEFHALISEGGIG